MTRTAPSRRAAPLRRAAPAAVIACLALVVSALVVPALPATAAPSTEVAVGTLVRAYDEGAADGLLTWVDPVEDAEAAVRVPTEAVEHLETGATVAVTVGREVRDAASEDGQDPARQVLAATVLAPAAEVPGSTGSGAVAGALVPAVHGVRVVMAVPAGGRRDATTLQQVVDAVNGPVSAYWAGQTDGAVSFAVTGATDWMTLSAGCSDPWALWSEVAARTGFTRAPDQHLLVHLGSPDGSGCSAGLAEVGASPSAGGLLYVTSAATSVIAHELGHNLGLSHASREQCDGALESATGCRVVTYDDLYDVMSGSWSQLGSLNPAAALHLGVLPLSQGADVTGSGGTFALSPVGSRSGLRAVRLRDDTGTYWLELRAAVGQDAWLGDRRNAFGLASGVVLRREARAAGEARSSPTTLLLDPTPSPAAGWAADRQTVLVPGASATVAGGRWSITVQQAGSSSATVSVTAAPGVTATPPTPALTGGTAADPVVTAAVERLEGATRYETATAISRASHPDGAATVVVASTTGDRDADALASGPTAARLGAPLLLVPTSGALPESVTAELARLRPSAVVVAGGEASVDAGVVAQLSAFAPVTRRSGADRYGTAAALATSTGAPGGTVYLASGTASADATAGSALAAGTGGALVLTRSGDLPAEAREALVALAPQRVVVLGGPSVVSDGVRDAAAAAVPSAAVTRLAGTDRYDTAAQVAAAGYPDGTATAYLALGTRFADALAAAPAAGRAGAPLLLTRGDCVPAVTLRAVLALGVERVVVLGSTGAVGPEAAAFRSC